MGRDFRLFEYGTAVLATDCPSSKLGYTHPYKVLLIDLTSILSPSLVRAYKAGPGVQGGFKPRLLL